MREEEISWLSWDADDVSTLPDMVANVQVFVVCTATAAGRCMVGLAHPASLVTNVGGDWT